MDNFVINYGLILIGLMISAASSLFIIMLILNMVKKTKRGMTGYEVARYILDKNGLYDISIIKVT